MPPKRRRQISPSLSTGDTIAKFTSDDPNNAIPLPADSKLETLFPTPSLTSPSLNYTYTYSPSEKLVLTYEPYKSTLLPHWRFRTLSVARTSSQTLKSAFDHYVSKRDFVGADMARKFIQMGMTRAKRYANHKGGRKYVKREKDLKVGEKRVELEKSAGHEGRDEKLAVSELFKGVWRECLEDRAYVELREKWKGEKSVWEEEQKHLKEEGEEETEVRTEAGNDNG